MRNTHGRIAVTIGLSFHKHSNKILGSAVGWMKYYELKDFDQALSDREAVVVYKYAPDPDLLDEEKLFSYYRGEELVKEYQKAKVDRKKKAEQVKQANSLRKKTTKTSTYRGGVIHHKRQTLQGNNPNRR